MTAPGYSHWTLFSVCMDCCCSLSAPNWASYKLHHSSLDWSAQQVVGSLRSYPDQDEERLASPEVPGAGAWGYIQCCWLLYDDRCGRSWDVFWCIAHEANKTRATVTPKERQSHQSKTHQCKRLYSRSCPRRPPGWLCCAVYYGRRLGQWNPVC